MYLVESRVGTINSSKFSVLLNSNLGWIEVQLMSLLSFVSIV